MSSNFLGTLPLQVTIGITIGVKIGGATSFKKGELVQTKGDMPNLVGVTLYH